MSNPEILTYVPFARDGERNLIPVTRQDGQDARLATFSGGYPKITMTPKSAGGEPPDGMDMNGVLYQISLDTVHRQSGKQMQYDATYATNIGGYSKGSVLQSTDLSTFWISTVDGNTTDPDSTNASGWNRFAYTPVATSTTTGTVKLADTLASNATDTALTANQGNVLNSKISQITSSNSMGYYQGYIEFKDASGNVVMAHQWGTVDYNSNPGEIQVDITFQKPFNNACLNIQATRKMSQHSTKGDSGVNIISTTKSGASFSVQTYNNTYSADCRGFTWFAIGN